MKCPFCKKKVYIVSPYDYWFNRKLYVAEICCNCAKEKNLKGTKVTYYLKGPIWKADIPVIID